MKVFRVVVLAAIVGAASGMGTAVFRLGIAPWGGDPDGEARNLPVPVEPGIDEPIPKVVVEQTEYDFGKMDVEGKGSHDFIFTNEGPGILELQPGGTSCGCTVAKLEKEKIPPSESARVTLKWRADEGKIGPYRESAKIRTNDPRRPGVTLVVKGRVTVAVRAVPSELVLGRMSAGESAAGEVALFCYLEEPMEILGYELLKTSTAEKFEVTFLPLSPGQLEEEPDAQGGRLVRIAVKPGLPLGAFRQRIEVRTSLKAAPTVVIPVAGRVGKEITIVGPRWNEEIGVLKLGSVSSQAGARCRLLLIARGPHRKEVRFKPVGIFPDLLKVRVELDQTSEINGGKAIQTPLIIQIPKGSPRANYLGSQQGRLGRITIETNHPDVPRIQIRVSFAIEG